MYMIHNVWISVLNFETAQMSWQNGRAFQETEAEMQRLRDLRDIVNE